MSGAGAQFGELVLLDEEPFAEGGSAELYRAQLYRAQRAGGEGQLVCVKLIRGAANEDEHVVGALAAEAVLAAKLRHPNVVRVYPVSEDDVLGEHEGRHFLVMEWIEGPDLATLIAHHGPLAPDLVAYVGASLARALAYIHHKDDGRPALIHFDVTPHNVLVGGDGAVKLSDFGIAKALGTTGAATLTRERGKAGYLAPEQLEPDAQVTSAVDLFSLGLVLWRALIGTHPYLEQCPPDRSFRRWLPAQLRKMAGGQARARRLVAEAAPTAPAGLCDAIERLLQPIERRTPEAELALAALEPHVRPTSAATLARLAASTPLGMGEGM